MKILVPSGYSGLYWPTFASYFKNLPDVLRQYDRLIYFSANYRDKIFGDQHSIKHYSIIPNAANEDEFTRKPLGFRQRFGIQTKYTLLNVANHYHAKGHHFVIEAFRKLGRDDLTLVILGHRAGGLRNSCYLDCRLAGLHPRIKVLTVDRSWVVSAFQEADIFVFGSEVEASPLVIFESMAAGIPFVSTDCGNVKDFRAYGRIVSTPDQMAKAVRALLNDEKARIKLGQSGQRAWQKNYTWENVTDRYEQLYRELLKKKRSTPALRVKKIDEAPEIDVVIPVYNGERYIAQALNSVNRQTYRPHKIIVVDDGSTDRTPEIVRRYKSQIPLRYVRKENGGLSSARNMGIRLSKNPWIALLDADDVWEPRKLAAQVDIFRKHRYTNVGLVYCDYYDLDAAGRKIHDAASLKLDPTVRGDAFHKLLTGNKVAGSGSAVLVKRECFETVGLFDTSFPACEDWDMWARIAERYNIDYAPTKLVGIRRHSVNMQKDMERMVKGTFLFFDKWASHPAVGEDILQQWSETLRLTIAALAEETPTLTSP